MLAVTTEVWQYVDLLIKILFPIVMAVGGWMIGRINKLDTRVTSIESNRIKHEDIAQLRHESQELERRIFQSLATIEKQTAGIIARLDERDRKQG